MRTAYATPAEGERYLIAKKAAQKLVRSALPEFELLAFQTRHGPNMTPGIPYCATYASRYLRILSVEASFASEAAIAEFGGSVMPWILKRITDFRATGYNWPCVAVILDGAFREAACSAGGHFPSVEEMRRKTKRSNVIAAPPI